MLNQFKEKKITYYRYTFRDAHQSLIATRMRTQDMLRFTDLYEEVKKFSIECWGGATFDVALRFLKEDPWDRLKIKRQMPSALLQMLFRGSNALGYTNYPDNVLKIYSIICQVGIDVFRIFDALNWIENMQVSIDEVLNLEKFVRHQSVIQVTFLRHLRKNILLIIILKWLKNLKKWEYIF